MGIEVIDDKKREAVITRVMVINHNINPIEIPDRYRCLFHGRSFISYGRHIFRFPITSMDYKRLVSSFQAEFSGKVTVDFGSSGTEEI